MSDEQMVTGAPVEDKPKTTRRRTTRAKAASAAEPVAETGAQDAAPKAPAKRTRARSTRANSADAASAEAGASQGAAPAAAADEKPKTTRRRRTTRAKADEAGAPAEAAAPAPAGEAAADKPKTTRRRRTTRVKAEEAEGAPAADQPAEPAETAEAAALEEPAKRTRTRRTRAKAAESAPADADAPKEAAPTADADEKPAATHHRRTRAKAAESEAAPAAAAATVEQPAIPQLAAPAPEQPEAKPGSAKPTAKPAPEAPAAPAPAQAQGQEDEEGYGHRRRRQRNNHREDQGGNQGGNRYGNASQGNRNRDRDHGNQGGQGKSFRNNKHGRNNSRREVTPSVTRDELAAMKVAELRAKGAELGLACAGIKKAELVDLVYDATLKAEGFIETSGILDFANEGYGFLRTSGYLPGEHDAYVGLATIRRYGLRKGDEVKGQLRPAREGDKFPALQRVDFINGQPADESVSKKRVRFGDLTPIYPDERLVMEHGKDSITARMIDLVAPIGKGQRGLIVSPPKAGKTTVLKNIAAAISANNPQVHLMCLLVDERPEEVTDMQRSIKGEVIASTFDMPSENHIAVSELVIERAKRLVEMGEDVVILLDSITRLARAYNLAQPASGRILSGGVDSTALYPPKRFLGAARNIENGGSLTILASALIDTGSKMDEVIFEEFKGTGNMELKLDRNLADRRIYPAIDVIASGTRKEELLVDPQQAPFIWGVRRILANLNNTERATDMLIKSLKRTRTNEEFLIRTAKRAQEKSGEI